MTEHLRAVKGMDDLFEDSLVTWRFVEKVAQETFLAYGYHEIRTPIVEEAAVFVRGVGEGTDIVGKEMFLFPDRDPKHPTTLCLRPENTAGVVRAMVENGKLSADAAHKVFYQGPMFRNERPQAGRRRQFHQIGAESFGFLESGMDVEMMALVHTLLTRLGIHDVKLLVNTLGDATDRPAFATALVDYFAGHKDRLSEDSKRRLEQNPLRILDSKDERDQELAKQAPKSLDFLSAGARSHFDEVTSGLARLGIPFHVEPQLVRGLDYYTRTVFEFVGNAGLGSQSTIAAGGRYDNLVETLGGRSTPAVGFAGGIERLVLVMTALGAAQQASPPALMLIGADATGREMCEKLTFQLRAMGLRIELDQRGRGVGAQMKAANRLGVCLTLVLGSSEIAKGSGQVKVMASGAVQDVALDAAALAAVVRAQG